MKKLIALRLSEETLNRIDRLVETTQLEDRSAVIRLCVTSFLKHFEENGEKITLPLDWEKIIKTQSKEKSQ